MLGIAVGAILIGVLRLATQSTPLPPGSSYSAEPDGALALYTWLDELGASPRRLSDPLTDDSVRTLLILQPSTLIDNSTRDAFDAVAQRGGTLVLAGDSIQWLLAARQLGVTVEPETTTSSTSDTARTTDGATLQTYSRFRLRSDAAGAEPLLTRPDGDWIGLTQPYRQGTLVVIASPDPFTNAGLADPTTARFVYRLLVAPAIGSGAAVAFDEIERLGPTAAPGQTTLGQLLFSTPPGRALLYVAMLAFVFIVLTGRRLGPALLGRPPADSQRSMYEHVQMLANLYRRAGQLGVVRSAFERHYSRQLAHAPMGSKRASTYADALARVQSARSEPQLVAAVASVDDDPR